MAVCYTLKMSIPKFSRAQVYIFSMSTGHPKIVGGLGLGRGWQPHPHMGGASALPCVHAFSA